MRRTLGVLIGALVVTVGLAGPASAQISGRQDFVTTVNGPTGSPGSALATGAFTGSGSFVAPQAQPVVPFPASLVFRSGTIFQTISPGANTLQFDPRTCLLAGSITGTYKITGGTGVFVGAAGGGAFRTETYAQFGRDEGGQCISFQASPPTSVRQVAWNTGTMTAPAA